MVTWHRPRGYSADSYVNSIAVLYAIHGRKLRPVILEDQERIPKPVSPSGPEEWTEGPDGAAGDPPAISMACLTVDSTAACRSVKRTTCTAGAFTPASVVPASSSELIALTGCVRDRKIPRSSVERLCSPLRSRQIRGKPPAGNASARTHPMTY